MEQQENTHPTSSAVADNEKEEYKNAPAIDAFLCASDMEHVPEEMQLEIYKYFTDSSKDMDDKTELIRNTYYGIDIPREKDSKLKVKADENGLNFWVSFFTNKFCTYREIAGMIDNLILQKRYPFSEPVVAPKEIQTPQEQNNILKEQSFEEQSEIINHFLTSDDIAVNQKKELNEIWGFFITHKNANLQLKAKLIKEFYNQNYSLINNKEYTVTVDEKGLNFSVGEQMFSREYIQIAVMIDKYIKVNAEEYSNKESLYTTSSRNNHFDEEDKASDDYIESVLNDINSTTDFEPISFLPFGTFFDYLNSIFIYSGTDIEDNNRHILRSLDEKNVEFSFSTEGFLELMLDGEAEIVEDPEISSVFGFNAKEEVYIWKTKYKIIDFDCDEVVFENINNSDVIRTENLLDTLEYLKHEQNIISDNHEATKTIVTEQVVKFNLDEDEISELIDEFILASDITKNTLEYQSEIYIFFDANYHKVSIKTNIVKSFYGNLDTSYTTQDGDYIKSVKSDNDGITLTRLEQNFYIPYELMAQRIEHFILLGEYPFSNTADFEIDDYSIPDEINEMNGVNNFEEDISQLEETQEIEPVSEGNEIWQEYISTKEKYPNDVIFYQIGDFFEVFDTDAVMFSEQLGFTLASRDMGLTQRISMCGIPKHTLDEQINVLQDYGYDVSVLEQNGNRHELIRSKKEIINQAIEINTNQVIPFSDDDINKDNADFIAPIPTKEDIIKSFILAGDGTVGSKIRIQKAINEYQSKSDRVSFIKKEYGLFGISGTTDEIHRGFGANTTGLKMEYTSDAFSLKENLTWSEVESLIYTLVMDDDYIQPTDIKNRLALEETEVIEIVADEDSEPIEIISPKIEIATFEQKTPISIFETSIITEEQTDLSDWSTKFAEIEVYEDNSTEYSDGFITGDEVEEVYPFPIGTRIKLKANVYEIYKYHYDGKTVEIVDISQLETIGKYKITDRRPTWEIADCEIYHDNNEVPQVDIKEFFADGMVYKATFEFEGKSYTSGITEQGDRHYVRVGSRVANNYQRVNLTAQQITEFEQFIENDKEKNPIDTKVKLNTNNENYRYLSEHNLYEGGPKTKCRANIEAIKLLKRLETEERIATAEEQIILAGYVGWGGLANALTENKSGWVNEYTEIKSLLTDEEFRSAEESTLTAYFTEQTVIDCMYIALERFGFRGGSILDPAMGTGNFFSVLPENMSNSKLYGVELDSITGQIAEKLYPAANIQIKGYEHTNFADSSFDVAIGNIPFNSININDSRYNKHNFSIHDYFIAKTLDKVRSGGIIAFITSKFTMDKANQNVRKYIAGKAELVGAIRLPNNAFKQVAGTEATTDILFLKKRDIEIIASQENSPWLTLEKNEDGVPVNSYFIDHPEMILGKMVFDISMYGDENSTACHPIDGEVLEDRLSQAIRYLDCRYEEPKSEYEGEKEHTTTSRDAESWEKNFSYALSEDGKVWYRENSKSYLQNIGGKKEERIRGLMEIHHAVRELIDFQTDEYQREQLGVYGYNQAITGKIEYLNEVYDKFIKKHGYINISANVTAFKKDGAAALLRSIETKDPNDTKKFGKTAMFYRPTIFKKELPKVAFNAPDALIMSLNSKGKVDLDYMAFIYVKSESKTGKATHGEIIEELGDKIYKDPQKMDRSNDYSGYVLADEYLSGYVKDKLAFAEFNAQTDPLYKRNVEALESVQPTLLEPHEISFELSSTWIPIDVYMQFIYELCDTLSDNQGIGGIELEYSEYTGSYHIASKKAESGSIATTETYGTSRKNAYEIIEESLNMKDVRVFDPKIVQDPKTGKDKKIYILNKTETILARAKQEEIRMRFKSWLFADPQRSDRLATFYNDNFNNIVVREYNGDDLSFPDMSDVIKLRKHQRDVIAHGLFSSGNLLMAHEVGSGKTYSAIALSYELKRIGAVHKPLITVPNHLVSQWAAEYMKLYPNANILVAGKKDLEKENRKRFCARIAASEYDAIIMAHTSFELIGLSREKQLEVMSEEISAITNAILQTKFESGGKWPKKQMELFKKRLQFKFERLYNADKKDNVITVEQLGIDCLVVDESHIYKNNFSYTKLRNVAGVGSQSSQRAMDMHLKAQYINQKNKGKGIIYLTGTPISNSMSELYVLQKTLQPNELAKRKHLMFDAWASHFGVIKNSLEIKPEGGDYQMKSRFAQFHNIPELMSLFRLVADIKTAEQLDEVPVPKLRTGAIQVIKSKIAPTQKDIVMALVERAEDIRKGLVSREEDNFLKLTAEAKLLSVDPRILDPNLPDDPDYKLNVCARKVAEIYHETAENRSTQLIFCDSGTPKTDGSFNFYDQTRKVLISEGVKPEEIAFIHDYNSDLQKEQLFEKMRTGEIRILMGSTQKMGTGMNIQDKLFALHNLDIPWKPSDLIQRIGRIVRQGNENDEVSVFNYITEDTFDSYLYQILEQKQRYITQIMNGDSIIRKSDDIDETVLQYAEFKALAISNPKLKEKMEVENELSRLIILKSAYHNSQVGLKNKVNKIFPNNIESEKRSIDTLTKDIECLEQHKPLEFAMMIDGHVYTERPRAAEHYNVLRRKLGIHAGDVVKIGTYAGFEISVFRKLGDGVAMIIKGEKEYQVELGDSELGAITRMENAVAKLPELLIKAEQNLQNNYNQLESAKVELLKPFPSEEKLLALHKRKVDLDLALEFKQCGDDDLSDEKEDENTDDTDDINDEEIDNSEPVNATIEQKLYKQLYLFMQPIIDGDTEYIKYKSRGYQDFVIEDIGNSEYSVAHYYRKNGNAMRDPEVTFRISEDGGIEPISFLQDNMGIFYLTEDVAPAIVSDLKSFMRTWFNNVKHYHYEVFKMSSYDKDEEQDNER